MNNTENAYCRLCAVCKPHNKLIDLQIDQAKRDLIVNNLILLDCQLDFNENILPRTVCLLCINSLTRASDFISAVKRAQVILKDVVLTQPIKRESDSSDSEETFVYEMLEEKYEDNIDIKSESDKEGTVDSTKNLKQKKVSDLDSIPLSQLKLTWQDYSWTCSYCETQFATITELISHSMEYHKSCNPYCCTDCNVRKLRLDRFLTHVRTHRKYLQLSCYKCFKMFPSIQEASKHRVTHITTDYTCNGCNTSLPSTEELKKHYKLFYKNSRSRNIPVQAQKDILTCLICKKEYKTKTSLNTHLLIHTDRKRNYTCEVCGKCFLQKFALAGHMMLHEDKRPFHCEICKSSFRTKNQLRYHVGVHDGEKPFSCQQCGRCFRLQKQLTSHSIIHTDSLPYVCSFCNKGFRFKTILNQHIRQHTGVRPYSCDICERDFTNWPNYNKHMKRRHSMDMAKKKHTPDGLYPIDKTTGKVIYPEIDKILEWKNKILENVKRGRPKSRKVNVKKIKSEETNNN